MKHKRLLGDVMRITRAAIFVVGFALCAWGADKSDGAGMLPQADAGALWQHITGKDHYRNWGLYPRKAALYSSTNRGLIPAKNPHGAYLRLRGNEIAIQSVKEAEDLPMPPGAILIKEDFARDKKTLLSITAMFKVEDYNPGQSDWFWARYGPEGQILESGKVESCIQCHKAQAAHDWRYTGATAHHHK